MEEMVTTTAGRDGLLYLLVFLLFFSVAFLSAWCKRNLTTRFPLRADFMLGAPGLRKVFCGFLGGFWNCSASWLLGELTRCCFSAYLGDFSVAGGVEA